LQPPRSTCKGIEGDALDVLVEQLDRGVMVESPVEAHPEEPRRFFAHHPEGAAVVPSARRESG
jgi:hypothetical protein